VVFLRVSLSNRRTNSDGEPTMNVLEDIQTSFQRLANMADRYRISIQQNMVTSLYADRLRAGANIIWERQNGLLSWRLEDPIGDKIRLEGWDIIKNYSQMLFDQSVKQIEKVRSERRFGSEDQVQHSQIFGHLTNQINQILQALRFPVV
ncbi:MAG: hypothetical protein N2315_08855, partial [Thermanaerothrix sp.]|nr:hypothetical protein [Thermanaerothrix sp.]